VIPERPGPCAPEPNAPPPLGLPVSMGVRAALELAAGHVAASTPGQIWVTGEVTQVTRSPAGHLYWTVLGDGARLACSALGLDARRVLEALAGANVALVEGLALRMLGILAVYVPRGSVELRVSAVDPRTALGAHELARRQLRAALACEGLDRSQARLAPAPAPLAIGIVAPAGAGLADLVGLLDASPWAWSIRTAEVSAEGSVASARIAAAIPAAAAGADLVVITRGGGAGIALPYDAEVVARAVCRCAVPVVAALGHTHDRSITDEVAWRSVPTPSAAAALLCALIEAADAAIVETTQAIALAVEGRLDAVERNLDAVEAAIARELAVAQARAERPEPARLAQVVSAGSPAGEAARLRRIALVCALVALCAIVVLAIVVGLR
jgi:exodeoxyribonuclease VII large subunit